MGSVNPIAITESAIEKVDKKMVQMLAGFALGAGQFCTQPGLLLVTIASIPTDLQRSRQDPKGSRCSMYDPSRPQKIISTK